MNRRKWTTEEDDKIRELYPTRYAKDIVGILDRSVSAIYGRAQLLGVSSDHEKIVRSGRESSMTEGVRRTQFKKGHVPPNKGKKVDAATYEKMSRTFFKKGQRPQNHKDVGSERVTKDGYIEIKVAEPNKWRLKHRVVWEQAYGKIPPRHNIQFRNGNSKDIRLENLYMISQAEQMRTENSLIARYPKELGDVIRLKGALKRKIKNVRNGK